MPTELGAEVTPAEPAVLIIDGPMTKRFKYNKFNFWVLKALKTFLYIKSIV